MRNTFFAIYLLVLVVAMVWPGFEMAQRFWGAVVVGWPFALVWHIAWIVATFFALWIYHLTGKRHHDHGS